MSIKENIDLNLLYEKVAIKNKHYEFVFKEFILDFAEILIDEVEKEIIEIKKDLINETNRTN